MFSFKNVYIRAILVFLGVLSVIFWSPWLVLIPMILLALLFRSWEVLLLGLAMDFMWLSGASIFPLPLFTLTALILVWGLEPFRNQLLV